jgi:hypothetical protein
MEMFGANHDVVHIKDDIQRRRYFGFSHRGSWRYMKIFKMCEPTSEKE